jgi:hypothetical protein
MAGNSIHVIHCGRDWEVKAEGESAPFYSAEDKDPVVNYARRLAKEFHAELVIHNCEGRVEYTELAGEYYEGQSDPSESKAEYGDGPGEHPGVAGTI